MKCTERAFVNIQYTLHNAIYDMLHAIYKIQYKMQYACYSKKNTCRERRDKKK